MYSQSFLPYNLYSCVTQSERRNRGLSKEDFIQKLELCVGNTIDEGRYDFKIKTSGDLYLNGQPKDSIEYLCQDLVLRKLYNNIKRIYRVEQSNRDQIVKQIGSLLKEKTPKWIIRIDIRHFYETINRNQIIENFQAKGRLSRQSINLLIKLFSNPVISSNKGLPRGLSISSVMSELYMKYFDLEIRRMNGVYYYARFVDDIIVFCSSKRYQEEVWEEIPKILSGINLQLNSSKSHKWNAHIAVKPIDTSKLKHKELTYLGYKFIPQEDCNLEITIADKKINTIKTRITKSFVRFAKDGDFSKLKNRIKFLTGNFTLYNPSTLLPIKVGIYFNYNMITDKTQLYNLDKYYQRLLHCKRGRLGTRLAAKISTDQRKDLSKYSFFFGFEKHVNHFFTSAMLADINNCWQ